MHCQRGLYVIRTDFSERVKTEKANQIASFSVQTSKTDLPCEKINESQLSNITYCFSVRCTGSKLSPGIIDNRYRSIDDSR